MLCYYVGWGNVCYSDVVIEKGLTNVLIYQMYYNLKKNREEEIEKVRKERCQNEYNSISSNRKVREEKRRRKLLQQKRGDNPSSAFVSHQSKTILIKL